MSSMETNVAIRLATRADTPAMARILTDNLLNFELHDHFVPSRKEHQGEYYNFLLLRIKLFFVRPETRYMVAVATQFTSSGSSVEQIVGFATWEAQGGENRLGKDWRAERNTWAQYIERLLVTAELEYHRVFLNRIVDYTGLAEVMRRLHDVYEGADRFDPCLHLQFLMVHPAWHRGRGVGRKLFQWGVDIAEELNMPMVVESSLVGYEFYLKCGCRLLEHVHIDIVKEKAYDMPIVVYEPRLKG